MADTIGAIVASQGTTPATPVLLLDNLHHFCNQRINRHQRKVLRLYFWTQILYIAGGVNYTSAAGSKTLAKNAANAFGALCADDVEALMAAIDYNNAAVTISGWFQWTATAGTAISTNIDSLLEDSKFLDGYPDETLDRMILYVQYRYSTILGTGNLA